VIRRINTQFFDRPRVIRVRGTTQCRVTVSAMRAGFTLVEMLVVLTIGAVVVAIAAPRLAPALDRLATDAAARDVTTALAVARTTAVLQSTRARLRIATDSLRVDRESAAVWVPVARWAGPASGRVALTVTNPEVVFGPLGFGWGAANTRVDLRRGSQIETVTTSRLGRVKRG
jgi:prepilin-type N-terminal cleavage/methylation domain-containing protein